MKILIVGQWLVSKDGNRIFIPGGTERYVYELAKQLQKNDYEVKVLSATVDKDKTGWSMLDKIGVYRFRVSSGFYGYFIDILSFEKTLKSIKKFNPDIVHVISTGYRFAMGAITAAKIMKKKVVYTRTTLPHEEGRSWVPILFDNLVLWVCRYLQLFSSGFKINLFPPKKTKSIV